MQRLLITIALSVLLTLLTGTASAQYIYTGSTSSQGLGFGSGAMPSDWMDMGPAFFIWSDEDKEQWTIRWSGRIIESPKTREMYKWNTRISYPTGTLTLDQKVRWDYYNAGHPYNDGEVFNPTEDLLYLDYAYAGDGFDGFNFSLSGDQAKALTFTFGVEDDGMPKIFGTDYEIYIDGNALSALTDDISGGVEITAHSPEPTTMILFGTGLLGLLGFGRKKFRLSRRQSVPKGNGYV